MKSFAVKLIHLYRKLSPVLFSGGFSVFALSSCKYWPTCSVYSEQAINKHGLVKGGYLSAKRVLKCNPLSQGGVDIP